MLEPIGLFVPVSKVEIKVTLFSALVMFRVGDTNGQRDFRVPLQLKQSDYDPSSKTPNLVSNIAYNYITLHTFSRKTIDLPK